MESCPALCAREQTPLPRGPDCPYGQSPYWGIWGPRGLQGAQARPPPVQGVDGGSTAGGLPGGGSVDLCREEADTAPRVRLFRSCLPDGPTSSAGPCPQPGLASASHPGGATPRGATGEASAGRLLLPDSPAVLWEEPSGAGRTALGVHTRGHAWTHTCTRALAGWHASLGGSVPGVTQPVSCDCPHPPKCPCADKQPAVTSVGGTGLRRGGGL